MGKTGSKVAKDLSEKKDAKTGRTLANDKIQQLVAGLTHEPSSRPPVEIKLPNPADAAKFAVYHSAMFSEDECAALINLAEGLGFSKGSQSKGIATATNVTIDSHTISSLLWERLQTRVPSSFKGNNVVGLDNKIRFLRYNAIDDAARDNGLTDDTPLEWLAMSKYNLSAVVFLNDDYDGGKVLFPDTSSQNPPAHIPCPAGQVLLMEDSVTSQQLPVVKGAKFVMRIDFRTTSDDATGDDLLAAEDAVGTMHQFNFSQMLDLPVFQNSLGTTPDLPQTSKDLDADASAAGAPPEKTPHGATQKEQLKRMLSGNVEMNPNLTSYPTLNSMDAES